MKTLLSTVLAILLTGQSVWGAELPKFLFGTPEKLKADSPALYFDPNAVAGTMVVGELLESQYARIEELLKQVEQTGDYLLAQALRNALTALDAFRYTADELLEKTFNELEKQQQTFFTNLQSTIAAAQVSVDDALQKAESIASTVEQTVNDMPFGKRRVAIKRYSPAYLIPGNDNVFTLKLEGLSLQEGKPRLEVGGKFYEPSELLLTSATFANIPLPEIGAKPVKIPATVHLLQPRFLRSAKKIKHPLLLTAYPKILGRYEITFRQRVSQLQLSGELTKLVPFEGHNVFLRHVITPTQGAGYYIDCSTTRFVSEAGEAGGTPQFDGPCSPTGFAVGCRVGERNERGRKKHGYQIVRLFWKETKTDTVEIASPVASGDVPTIGDLLINKPTGTFAVEGSFVDFDGNRYSLRASPLVVMTEETNRIVIKPRQFK